MGNCRKGHGQFPGKQCKVCKANWEKAHRPERGKLINAKRAMLRQQAYAFGRIAPTGKPVSLTDLVVRKVSYDHECPSCGGPTVFGSCIVCS